MHVDHSDYLSNVFSPARFKSLIEKTIKQVRQLKRTLKFDAIAFTGISGAGVAFPVSARTGIPLMCIRKELNVPHGLRIEGAERVINRYLILDDLIESGSTIERIIRIINREAHYKRERPECVGILLWRDPFIGPFKYKDQEIPVYSVK